MTTDIFCFYLQNRRIQTSQTGGQWYSDTSPFSIPWYTPWSNIFGDTNKHIWVGICKICVNQKISVLNEMKWNKILLKLEVKPKKVLLNTVNRSSCGWNFPNFHPFFMVWAKLVKFSKYLMNFPTHFRKFHKIS